MSESFWVFSVRTYRCDNVPEACLALQDERGIDVNMLLYCCWYGATRGMQDIESFNTMFDFSESWADNIIRPLRSVRTWMKHTGCVDSRVPMDSCMDFREKVKGVEFIGEKMQQELLESLTTQDVQDVRVLVDQLKAMAENIQQYLVVINVDLDDFVTRHLTTIIDAALPEASIEEVTNSLKA